MKYRLDELRFNESNEYCSCLVFRKGFIKTEDNNYAIPDRIYIASLTTGKKRRVGVDELYRIVESGEMLGSYDWQECYFVGVLSEKAAFHYNSIKCDKIVGAEALRLILSNEDFLGFQDFSRALPSDVSDVCWWDINFGDKDFIVMYAMTWELGNFDWDDRYKETVSCCDSEILNKEEAYIRSNLIDFLLLSSKEGYLICKDGKTLIVALESDNGVYQYAICSMNSKLLMEFM